jgi:hypothetical protein
MPMSNWFGRMAEHHYKKNALLRQLHSWYSMNPPTAHSEALGY